MHIVFDLKKYIKPDDASAAVRDFIYDWFGKHVKETSFYMEQSLDDLHYKGPNAQKFILDWAAQKFAKHIMNHPQVSFNSRYEHQRNAVGVTGRVGLFKLPYPEPVDLYIESNCAALPPIAIEEEKKK